MNLLDENIQVRIRRILTQYRESPNLIHLIRVFLSQIQDIKNHVENLTDYFDINTAVGDQLTLIGKRIGWGRSHCVYQVQPVFGFECEGQQSPYPIAGLCDDSSIWIDCGAFGAGEISINDDELYRKFLKVRTYQMQAKFDLESLELCAKIFWGDTALVLDSGRGRVVIAPGRELTNTEVALLQLYPRVFPVSLGIQIRFHFESLPVFGFGDGWLGFCESWEDNGLPLSTGEYILTTVGEEPILTGPLFRDGIWMCEIDVRPYDFN